MIDLTPYKTDTVVALIRRCLGEGWDESPTLPILADALEEVGFIDIKTLVNLRAGNTFMCDKEAFIRIVAAGDITLISGGSWDEVFKYAGEPNKNNPEPPRIRVAKPGTNVPLTPFARWDVEEVFGVSEGENDTQNWLAYGRLTPVRRSIIPTTRPVVRYFFITAGCDYTGWG